MHTSQSLVADNIGLRITQEQSSTVIHNQLLSLNNQLATLLLVKLHRQLIKYLVQFWIAIAGTILRIGAIYIGFPVPVQEYLWITSIGSGNIGNQQIIFALDAHLVNEVVIHILDVDINTDFLHI